MLLKRIYYAVAVVGIVYISLMIFFSYKTITTSDLSKQVIETFYSYKEIISFSNFIFFFILLFISGMIFYKSSNILFFVFSTIIYLVFINLNHWFLSGIYNSIKQVTESVTGEYVINIMISIFYSIAAISITTITYIALKNLTDRQKRKQEHTN